MGTMDMLYLFPMVIIAVILFVAPISLEKTNAKRVAKGKPELTEDEFARMIKRERIISVIILAACLILVTVIRSFAGQT